MKDISNGITKGDFTKASLNAGVLGMSYAAGGASKISQASGA